MAVLRSDLSRRSLEAEKAAEDRSENDKKSANLNGQLLQLQSQLRESESNCLRFEKENLKITSELDQIKTSLQDKEGDLRASLASLHEIQKHSNDERTNLRTEIS